MCVCVCARAHARMCVCILFLVILSALELRGGVQGMVLRAVSFGLFRMIKLWECVAMDQIVEKFVRYSYTFINLLAYLMQYLILSFCFKKKRKRCALREDFFRRKIKHYVLFSSFS